MKCFVGVDLGSTTSKAIYMDENENILGRGITNSRSNYDLACQIAREEAEINSRFEMLKRSVLENELIGEKADNLLEWLLCKFKYKQHLEQEENLVDFCCKEVQNWENQSEKSKYLEILDSIFSEMQKITLPLFAPGIKSRSDFFRDIAASQFLDLSEKMAKNTEISLDKLVGIFDTCIIKTESKSYAQDFEKYLQYARDEVIKMQIFEPYSSEIQKIVNYVNTIEFEVINMSGTGYGRQKLPFQKEQIRSEILCHGLGAHYMFPNTRTVLDIGGQDTKAIQVDENGIVTSFQMNDRCAAGCGRYLGYIADEMNMGVQELGPMAMKSKRTVKINSTCTVFAGAELRERLSLGEKREDIVAGLHRAIILRAMSLLARSGGIKNEFTFTGGVAKNEAATNSLKTLVRDNYGDLNINISPDSIYTGACGAALFAKRDLSAEFAGFDIAKLKKRVSQ